MVTVRRLHSALDRLFPFSQAGTWDRVGLQVGAWDAPAGMVGVCHEVTPHAIDLAIATGVNTMITYHPLLFTPTTAFVSGDTSEGRALRLAASGVAVISVHTAFDVAQPGTADALLARMGLTATATFGPVDDGGGADIGRIASLPTPMMIADLRTHIESITKAPTRAAGRVDSAVSRIGVIPGSGGSFVSNAIDHMDVLITGDVSHHEAAAASTAGLVVVDAGHIASERAGVEALYSAVCTVAPDAIAIDDDPDPWEGSIGSDQQSG